MKVRQIILGSLAALALTPTANALSDEGKHWVCETETLYRSLLSARLYGVGKEPEHGCQTLPTGVAISQQSCIESDIKLCQYLWTEDGKNVTMWGSAIISTLNQ